MECKVSKNCMEKPNVCSKQQTYTQEISILFVTWFEACNGGFNILIGG